MKQKDFKQEKTVKIKKEEGKMPFWTRKKKNAALLIGGIILILIGISGTSVSLLQFGINSPLNIPPFLFFIVGIFFAYMGATEKWR